MTTHYTVRHVTRFRYSAPVSEQVCEVRKQPRDEGTQTLKDFSLRTRPAAPLFAYADHLGNTVYHFNVPQPHAELVIASNARVEVSAPPAVPRRLAASAWDELDRVVATGEHWDFLQPSVLAHPSDALTSFCAEHGLRRGDDPMSTLWQVTQTLWDVLEYVRGHTEVDSPIEHALQVRRGVCQDFAHITIAIARQLGIPSRYVSGYLAPNGETEERVPEHESHAWIEAWMPGQGWLGIDPTNREAAGSRHIRVAIGRDYDDVPPTRGVYRGEVESELAVSVRVSKAEGPEPGEAPPLWRSIPVRAPAEVSDPAGPYRRQKEQQQ